MVTTTYCTSPAIKPGLLPRDPQPGRGTIPRERANHAQPSGRYAALKRSVLTDPGLLGKLCHPGLARFRARRAAPCPEFPPLHGGSAMRRAIWLCTVWLVVGTGLAGCGSNGSSTPTAKSDTTKESKSSVAQGNSKTKFETPDPEVAVETFLEAVRKGDEEKANAMLTSKAREETKKSEMLAPAGSKTAKFKVGDVEMVSEEVAHVTAVWTDVDEEGQSHRDEIVWMLRLEEGSGWRIAGMATKIFEDQEPLLLNFEDPEDMQRKKMLAEQEIMRRARLEAEAAAKDGNTPDKKSRAKNAKSKEPVKTASRPKSRSTSAEDEPKTRR